MSTNYKAIKTFSAACKALKLNASELISKWEANGFPKHIIAELMLEIFIEAINGDWKPDFANTNQKKWFPVFYYDLKKGFVLNIVDYLCAYSRVSSRLCYENEEKAIHGCKYGIKIYNDYLK